MVHFCLRSLKFDLIMNSWPQLPQPRYLREQEILQMSHNLHSWKRECSSICLGNFFTFSERSLYHLLRIFRFPSLVCKISGLTVKDTVIGNCTPLENVGGIKWPWGPAIRRHWCKATIFSDQFSRRGPMNCHKSLARSYLTRGHLPWEDSIPLNFLWRILDTPKMMMARGGISNVNGKKGWELRDKSMWSL